MQSSEGKEAERPADSADMSLEKCLELLITAKREGREAEKERLYRHMSDRYLEVLRTPGVFGRLTAGEREHILARRMEGRKVLAVAETSEVTQSPQQDDSRRVFCLDTESQAGHKPERWQWEELTRLPEEIPAKGSAMCTLYNYLFVAGGMSGSKASDRVFCFNPRTRLWSQIRPLSEPRCQLQLVSMDGHLYAVGGECLFTVERYDPRADRWSAVAPLPKGSFAVAHETTSCGGELFVSGGSLFYRLLRYDSRRDEWEECPFNESRRRSTDMVAHRSLVYRFDVERERAAVSVYKYNTVAKAWHGAASFPLSETLPFRCAVLGERIYCVNRSSTLQFDVREESEGFLPDVLPSPPDTRGALVPFVLAL
ncbi:kelch repeat and BTB domain-containing protein 11-like isoform X1 [Sander vitreus]